MPYFARIEGVEVDLICNRTEATNREFAEKFGVPRTTTDWHEVVTDPALDIMSLDIASGPGDSVDLSGVVDLGLDLVLSSGWLIRFGATIGDRDALAIGVKLPS